MSNFTHIPKWDEKNRRFGIQQEERIGPKYRIRKRQTVANTGIREGAVRTVCDRSDRNYNNQRGHNIQAYSPGRVTKERVTHKAGLFGNAKESVQIRNLLGMGISVRRNVAKQVDEIIRPDDSVEYLRPPINDYLRARENSGSHQFENYNEQQPCVRQRKQNSQEFQEHCNNQHQKIHRHNSWRSTGNSHNGYQSSHQYYSNEQRDRTEQHYRQDKAVGRNARFDYGPPSPKRSNLGEHNQRHHHNHQQQEIQPKRCRQDQLMVQRRRAPLTTFPVNNNERDCCQDSPQLPSMFAKGYRPLIQIRRPDETPNINSICSQQFYWSGSQSMNRTVQSSNITYQAASRTTNASQESPIKRTQPEINYPAKILAARMLSAIPRIPLRDDANDRYGATARNLLQGSIQSSKLEDENNNESHGVTMQDLLNRTTILHCSPLNNQNLRNGENENIFQNDRENFMSATNSTPDREREFNRTLAAVNQEHDEDNYQIPIMENFDLNVENSQMSIDDNVMEFTSCLTSLQSDFPAIQNSPADEDFLREIDRLVKQQPEEMPFAENLF